MGTFATHQVSVFGTEGVIHFRRAGQELFVQEILDPVRAKHMLPSIEPVEFSGPLPHAIALTEELEDFARCVRTGGKPEVGAPEGILSLCAIRGILESARTRKAIDL